jgi:predicted ATP-grasp superfamily ATP-dependent carboligase
MPYLYGTINGMIDNFAATDTKTIVEAIHNLHARGKLSYATFSDEWVIKFWRGDITRFILGYFSSDINSLASSEIARDKVATYCILTDAGVAAVPHILLTSPIAPEVDQAQLETLFATYRTLVIKPTQGSSGREIARCDTIASVYAHIQTGTFPSWSASPLLDLTTEIRLVLYNGIIRLAHKKENPTLVRGVRMFNMAHGATATRLEPSTLEPSLISMAQHAMQAIGLRFGAVDIVFDGTNTPKVIEINSRFSLEHYAELSPENRREIVQFYEYIIEDCLR